MHGRGLPHRTNLPEHLLLESQQQLGRNISQRKALKNPNVEMQNQIERASFNFLLTSEGIPTLLEISQHVSRVEQRD